MRGRKGDLQSSDPICLLTGLEGMWQLGAKDRESPPTLPIFAQPSVWQVTHHVWVGTVVCDIVDWFNSRYLRVHIKTSYVI